MGFGKELSDEFQKLSKGRKYNECQLFTKLEDSFIQLSTNYPFQYEITVLHGYEGQVRYENSNYYVFRKRATGVKTLLGYTCEILGVLPILPVQKEFQCELSDLAFIVYSKEGIKVTYMQNKLEKQYTLGKDIFTVDVDQLALLKGRPKFEIINKNSNLEKVSTNSILYDADVESVGSYGVFFENNLTYDMCYYPADLLSYTTSNQLTRTLNKTGTRYKKIPSKVVKFSKKNVACGTPISNDYRYIGTVFEDCLCACSLEAFGDELMNFHIGTLLNDNEMNQFFDFLKERNLYTLLENIRAVLPLDMNLKEDVLEIDREKREDRSNTFAGAKTYIILKAEEKSIPRGI